MRLHKLNPMELNWASGQLCHMTKVYSGTPYNTRSKDVPFMPFPGRSTCPISVCGCAKTVSFITHCLAFLVKNTPLMLAHPRYLIYKEYPPPPPGCHLLNMPKLKSAYSVSSQSLPIQLLKTTSEITQNAN